MPITSISRLCRMRCRSRNSCSSIKMSGPRSLGCHSMRTLPNERLCGMTLEFPKENHSAHNDYPLAPERMRVKDEWLSDKLINIRSQYNIPRGDGTSKLIPNLMNKKCYVIHYRNLRFYLEHGMKLTKVHNAIRFTQKAWLQSYIEMNQKLRAEATTTFDTDFYKLMNNAVFGKTCENQKKRTNICIVQDKQKHLDYVAKLTFMNFRIFGDELMAVEMQKTQNLINRPFYAGFAILELAKLHMYRYLPFCLISLYIAKEKEISIVPYLDSHFISVIHLNAGFIMTISSRSTQRQGCSLLTQTRCTTTSKRKILRRNCPITKAYSIIRTIPRIVLIMMQPTGRL